MQYKPKTEKLVLQAPASIVNAVDQVAARRFESRSQYVRQAILKALESDGVLPIAA